MSEHTPLTEAELGDLAAAYGWWRAHGDPEAFYDTLNDALAARLADAEARAEAAEAKVARVEAAMAEPYNHWWHTGGTPCIPQRVIREALRGGQ